VEPWYKIAELRKEVREGRSFNPDEFAIALEQVAAGNAPGDYQKPDQFFSRTCFTRALVENSALVLRRLAGETQNTVPVQTLVTQMGGGKTHMLTALWHLARGGSNAAAWPGISDLLKQMGLSQCPSAAVAVFVGNAWDPQPGRETPWIDIARQISGDEGVRALGPASREAPPGTESLGRVIELANQPVLLLFDEVLNFFGRHRGFAEPMHSFIHNIVRGFIGTNHRAAVISLPRSQVEMTDWEQMWQDRIVKVVGAVAKPLLVNDEAEIGEVVRRRLFEDLGNERIRKNVAKAFADWCFERRAQLPPEWTSVDTATTEAKARDYLRSRFESCYPFHPATLSVFQRKWQALPQYQQTRGTLAMLAQWVSWAHRDGYQNARREPLITLGSAPLDVMEFRSAVLGQLGESRLVAAIDADIAGPQAHARALDADTRGPLRDIHRRVATAILFESSGGQIDQVAHMPELRFALGEPEIDTTSIDTAALTLESKAYFIRKAGSDGFRIHHKPTLKKVVNDRRASLDYSSDVKTQILKIVDKEFRTGAPIPIEAWKGGSEALPDSPKLTVVVMDADLEWTDSPSQRVQVAEWTMQRGRSPRLFPGALVWCFKKVGRELREAVESMLAWRKVAKEVSEGSLGSEFDKADKTDIQVEVKLAEEEAKDEVWASYVYVVVSDNQEPDGLKVIDLGAGHASASETLCGRIIAALKSRALLNESFGAGYLERNWPPALKQSGAWPLSSLRQSFLNGALTRLLDPDGVLRSKIVEFVSHSDLGLASGQKPDGTFERVWFDQTIPADEVAFDANVFLLSKAKAKALTTARPSDETSTNSEAAIQKSGTPDEPTGTHSAKESPDEQAGQETSPIVSQQVLKLEVLGSIPPEVWNRLGTKLLPKLRSGRDLELVLHFTASFDATSSRAVVDELKQVLEDLGLEGRMKIQFKT
jgi:hypothetical protein